MIQQLLEKPRDGYGPLLHDNRVGIGKLFSGGIDWEVSVVVDEVCNQDVDLLNRALAVVFTANAVEILAPRVLELLDAA